MIQFHHKRIKKRYWLDAFDVSASRTVTMARGGTTYALQVPTVEEFDSIKALPADFDGRHHIFDYSQLGLSFGVAKCSDDDNYNKSIGRNIASGRMKYTGFTALKEADGRVSIVPFKGDAKLILEKRGSRIYFVEAV